MSITEIDKDLLLREILEIKTTLDAGNVANLQTDLNEADAVEGGYSDEDDGKNNELVIKEQTDYDNNEEGKSYYYQPQPDSDEEDYSSVSSDDESSYNAGASAHTKKLPTFGHFFKAMDDNVRQIEEPAISPSSPAVSFDGSTTSNKKHPTFGHFFKAMNDNVRQIEDTADASLPINVRSGISQTVRERIEQQSSGARPKSATDSPLMSPAGADEDSEASVDLSLPSTSSLAPYKKARINMTNLYVERIFRGIKKKNKTPTVASVRKMDTRSIKSSAKIGTMENLLLVNREYQESLMDDLKNIRIALMKNRMAQDEVTTKKSTGLEKLGNSSLNRACLGKFMTSYFKDKYGMSSPDNEDTIARKQMSKVNPFSRGGRPWRAKEVKQLEMAVYNNNLEKILEPLLQELKEYDKDYKERHAADKNADRSGRSVILKKISEAKALPKKEVMKASYDIDYFKISKNYVEDREEMECQLYWCNVLHPSINQNKFTKEEDAKILQLAKNYKNRHWEDIAKELDTNRTPVQCLQRFQRTLNKSILKTKWNEEDDKRLTEGIRLFPRNWVAVADYVGDRTADQCVHRWEHTVNPAIKRGKWSEEEDEKLLRAVAIHGKKNWKVVKTFVPGRTDSQCRERYVARLAPDINNSPFSKEEDELLIQLTEEYGVGKWSFLTKFFPGRMDNQLLRRFRFLEPDKQRVYKKQVLDKKKKVLTYFMHRQDEKREYNLEDLDLGDSAGNRPINEKKLNQMRERLKDDGYSTDVVEEKLEQMKRDGVFNASKTQRRKQTEEKNNAQNRNPYTKALGQVLIRRNELMKLKRVKLRVGRVLMGQPELFQKQCREALNRLQRGNILINQMEEDLELCEAALLKEQPERIERLLDILVKTKKASKAIISKERRVIKKTYYQTTLACSCIKESPSTFSGFNKSNRRKGRKPMRVVTVESPKADKQPAAKAAPDLSHGVAVHRRLRSRKDKENEKQVQSVEIENVENVETEDVVPSIEPNSPPSTKPAVPVAASAEEDDSTAPDEVLAEGAAEVRTHTKTQPESNDLVVTDKLKIFTLLLQALHVDTAGVMSTLPESHLADTVKTKNPYTSGTSFPFCHPLSPNAASLRGFRTLLLHRKKLTEQLEKCNVVLNKSSLRNTPSYDALNMRFQSLFMWPVFLATFMPRHAQDTDVEMIEKLMTPSKLPNFNFNKRMTMPARYKLVTPKITSPLNQPTTSLTIPPSGPYRLLTPKRTLIRESGNNPPTPVGVPVVPLFRSPVVHGPQMHPILVPLPGIRTFVHPSAAMNKPMTSETLTKTPSKRTPKAKQQSKLKRPPSITTDTHHKPKQAKLSPMTSITPGISLTPARPVAPWISAMPGIAVTAGITAASRTSATPGVSEGTKLSETSATPVTSATLETSVSPGFSAIPGTSGILATSSIPGLSTTTGTPATSGAPTTSFPPTSDDERQLDRHLSVVVDDYITKRMLKNKYLSGTTIPRQNKQNRLMPKNLSEKTRQRKNCAQIEEHPLKDRQQKHLAKRKEPQLEEKQPKYWSKREEPLLEDLSKRDLEDRQLSSLVNCYMKGKISDDSFLTKAAIAMVNIPEREKDAQSLLSQQIFLNQISKTPTITNSPEREDHSQPLLNPFIKTPTNIVPSDNSVVLEIHRKETIKKNIWSSTGREQSTSDERETSTDNPNVFVPKTLPSPPGIKRTMLDNSVVALENETPAKKPKL